MHASIAIIQLQSTEQIHQMTALQYNKSLHD